MGSDTEYEVEESSQTSWKFWLMRVGDLNDCDNSYAVCFQQKWSATLTG